MFLCLNNTPFVPMSNYSVLMFLCLNNSPFVPMSNYSVLMFLCLNNSPFVPMSKSSLFVLLFKKCTILCTSQPFFLTLHDFFLVDA